MSASPNRPQRPEPTPIDSGALENLRYIRSTIEAAHTFTTVPGKGCIAMGVTALLAVGLESIPALAPHWLGIWIGAAIIACTSALWFMEQKAHAQGLSLRRAVARRFFMTLAPAFLSGAILTAALAGRVDRELISGMWLLLYGTGLAACGLFTLPAVFTAGIIHGARHGDAMATAGFVAHRARTRLRRYPSRARNHDREAPWRLRPC
jgi:hypothetical protein